MPNGAGAADRSERAQLRDGAAAWRAGTGASRTRVLFCRNEIIRTRAHLPDDDGIRTGSLDSRRYCRRSGAAERVELVLPEPASAIARLNPIRLNAVAVRHYPMLTPVAWWMQMPSNKPR